MYIELGRWTQDGLDRIIHKSSRIKITGSRINFLSGQFLNVGYEESTLIGDVNTPEVFVINLKGVDCFTFIEYIEAMRMSSSFFEFPENLKRVRYRTGKVTFENRNHFFTDWKENNSEFIMDVTEQIGIKKTEKVIKMLNKKEDGTYFLPGIHPKQREIMYIPSKTVDYSIINKLETGDYAGIYSAINGLDVSHVGIIIKEGSSIKLRHASSAKGYRKVVDQEFKKYIRNKPGLIVIRPRDITCLK